MVKGKGGDKVSYVMVMVEDGSGGAVNDNYGTATAPPGGEGIIDVSDNNSTTSCQQENNLVVETTSSDNESDCRVVVDL